MATLRTLESLDDAIDSETAWRKRELTTAVNLIQRSSGPAQAASLRFGVLILYAHWEGWVKAVARLYIRYVNGKEYAYNTLSDAFLGNALKTRMTVMSESTKPGMHSEFASFIRSELSEKARLSEKVIRTESNLSSVVFFDILDRLGLERREKYALRANMIDSDLVQTRNSIAHGQYLQLEVPDYQRIRDGMLEILELFTDDVRDAAATERHLVARPVVSRPGSGC